MRKNTPKTRVLAIGMDIGDRKSDVALVGKGGEVLAETKIATTAEGIEAFFSKYEGMLVVFEAGTHSPWIDAQLKKLDVRTLVANPWSAGRAISANGKKNDRIDAALLAQFALNSPLLLRPIQHRSLEAQSDRAVLKSRDALVRSRTKLVNTVRGLVKSSGHRLPGCDTDYFARHASGHIPEELQMALNPLLEVIERLTREIHNFDRKIKKLSEKYPETEILQQADGVGDLTALAFILTLEDSKRFKSSRQVGAFLGLTRRIDESGESKPELRITKAGDKYLRRLLVSCAHHVLGKRGKDCELKRFGLRLASGGTKRAKNKAVVAVARKLAVLLHRLWDSKSTYDPFYNENQRLERKSA